MYNWSGKMSVGKKVAVVGATGVVGIEMLKTLELTDIGLRITKKPKAANPDKK